jgi:DNA-binding CsgD family transcriptional regulator
VPKSLPAGWVRFSVNVMAAGGPPAGLDVQGGELTGFVGRRAELAGVRAAVAGARLVTLTGPGGIGKTRLAVRAAALMRRAFRDGVWLVELAGLRDGALLASEVARSLGLLDQSSRWGVAALAERLAGREILLVIDNCEHLRDACAVLALVQGDAATARRWLQDALTAGQRLGDARAVAYASQFLGRAVWFTGEPERGVALTEEALDRHRAAGDWQGVVLTLVQLGVMRALTGQPGTAVGLLEECAAQCAVHGERWNRSYALWALGLASWLLGDHERAEQLQRAALKTKRDVGDQVGTALCLDALAWIAATRGQAAAAAGLLGAAVATWDAIPATLPGPLAPHRETAVTRTRAALGEASFTAHLARARAMPTARAVALALREPPPAAADRPPSTAPARLTPRERDVAALIAGGLSNREIAARMVISVRTAESHVQHIMAKLGFTTRSQIAAWTAGDRTLSSGRAESP